MMRAWNREDPLTARVIDNVVLGLAWPVLLTVWLLMKFGGRVWLRHDSGRR